MALLFPAAHKASSSRLLGTGSGVKTGVCNHLDLGSQEPSCGRLQVPMTGKVPQSSPASEPGPEGLRETDSKSAAEGTVPQGHHYVVYLRYQSFNVGSPRIAFNFVPKDLLSYIFILFDSRKF